MKNRIYYALAAVLAFAYCYDVAHAQQIGFPSRPNVFSLGADCNSQTFATNELGSSTLRGFLCVGQYPYLIQDPNKNGFIGLTVPTGAGTGSYASFYTFENTDGNAAFGLSDGGGVNGLTVGGDYEGNYNNVEMWELGSRFTGSFAFIPENLLGTHLPFFLLGDPGGSPGSDTFQLVFENNANGCIFCPSLLGTNLDQSGEASFYFSTFNPLTGEGFAGTPYAFRYTESTGAVIDSYLEAATGQWGIFDDINIIGDTAAMDGSYSFKFGGTTEVELTSGQLDLRDVSIVDSTDTNVNIGNDVSIVGDLNVTGTITAGGGGVPYAIYVDATASAEHVPSGWSVSNPATGTYTVTHNLSLATANDLSVVCNIINISDDDFIDVTPSTNSFDVFVSDSGSGVVNRAFFCLALGNL